MPGKLIVITGPTACGKTALTVQLAKQLGTEIVSCDSRQFYKEMAIGTAKPLPQEMDGVPHHFINSHPITDEINAGQYELLALEIIHNLFQTHSHVILTGGSGLFIDAVLRGFDHMPAIKPGLRENLNKRLAVEGLTPLVKELTKLDPKYASQADLSNPKRVIRGLEVCLSGDKTYTELRTNARKKRNFDVLKIVLDRPRQELYNRINLRVDLMMAEGLLNEVKLLIPFRNQNALNTVGYKELFDYLDGKTSLEEAVELIKRNSRRYAKRQLTWFRRSQDYHWVHPDNVDEITQLISQF